LIWWLAPAPVLGAITAIAGYLEKAPIYLLIPAVLGTIAFTFSLAYRIIRLSQTRASSRHATAFDDLSISVDLMDHQAKLRFTPNRNIARLRIRLDRSNFVEGSLGIGPFWAMPLGSVIADLPDILSGVRQTVSLTEVGERETGPGLGITGQPSMQYFL
jgi:hypothetical protein